VPASAPSPQPSPPMGERESCKRLGQQIIFASVFAAVLALDLSVFDLSRGWAYELTILGGSVHGPGAMPDTPLPQGQLTNISLNNRLGGVSEFFNNGAEPPNLPGEMEIYGHLGGKLSNGVPFNEHTYGGVVTIGQGALKMLSTLAGDGELKGRETYELDERLNWVLHADLALDPGFPQGLVISRNVKITTGVLIIPPSLQTEAGLKGGADLAGSYPSGAPVYGRLGDRDGDGFLDGRIVGIGRVPLGFMFVPGGPLVMQRDFKTDIPVTPEEAGILTLAGLHNLLDVLDVAKEGSAAPPAARAYVLAHAKSTLDDFAERARSAHSLLSAAGSGRATLAAQAAAIETVLKQESESAQGWSKVGAVPQASFAAIRSALGPVDTAVPALRADLHFAHVGG
jgi:hypothetical protein